MIQSLHIKNFQSHGLTDIEFAPTINAIVGTSNSGKTAIIRAFDWVRRNRPLGSTFQKKGTRAASVKLIIDNSEIERVRSRAENKYTLNDDLEFSTPHGEVPDSIASLLNIEDINVQRQFDEPFLAFSSPGRIAVAVMEAVKLDKAGELVSALNAKSRNAGREAERQQEEKAKVQKLLDEPRLACIPKAEKLAAEAQKVEDDLVKVERAVTVVASAVKTIIECDKLLSKLGFIPKLNAGLEKLQEQAKQEESFHRLSTIVCSVNDATAKIKEIDSKPKLKDIEPIQDINKKIESLQKQETFLDEMCKEIDKCLMLLHHALISEEEVKETLSEELPRLVYCPTCGQRLSEQGKSQVLVNYCGK